ncbi:hypothetical protein C2S53_003360 [Perilla frutescens var. hirtella]|uniref:DUF4378 domain-containing protein n=1 Tax=Perilla frutescens var. hirtella TaxID=608512 RepID=A0AAD4ISY6_PERFH|nr:hypothetical protein C2S53_003360 [Perilla frutescens var. hirtella]
MAAKLLHSLTDDNVDLQKQIGCMNGIFQLFDRQNILTGGRRVVGNTPKRPEICDFNGDSDTHDEHLRSASTEKTPVKNIQEKQRVSTESSCRVSFSSLSRSSSSSSLDCSRATHQSEPSSFDRIIFPEIPSRDPAMSLQNRDLRDLVKDSMYREIQGMSIKVKTTDPVIKYRDSPRMHDDLKESLRVLAKFQEAPLHHNEHRPLLRSLSYNSKDGPSSLNSRDAPRFSYDGREVNRAPFDSRDVSKSTLKLKELPRLSLDGSKAGSMRSLHAEFDGKVQNLQQSSSSGHQARPPSVVAKLMGLEALPHSVSPIDTNSSLTKSHPDKDSIGISRSFAEREPSSVKLSSSSWKEPNSPRWRNPDSSMKPLSRFPIEPAPWKHTDGRRSSQKPGSRTKRAPAKAETAFPSVYSEIEKRLKDLEFTQSGKDLRALKQILEAMQSKKLLQTQKEALGSNFTSHKDHEEKQLRFKHEARSVDRRKPQTEEALAFIRRNTIAARHSESPIVIMKPAKPVEKAGIPAASVFSLDGLSGVAKLQDNEFVDNRKVLSSGSTAKDMSSKSSQRESTVTSANMKYDRTLKAAQTSTRSQQLAKDGYAGLGKSSPSISPRLQQKKLELEKRARPPTPPDSSKSRRQPNRQLGESNSPGGRRRPKHSNIQESGVNVESRNLNYRENENLVLPNASADSSERSPGISTCMSPSRETSEFMFSDSGEQVCTLYVVYLIDLISSTVNLYYNLLQISTIALNEEKSADFAVVPVEYSSPVSVLDNRIHKDDSPSSVVYKEEISKDNEKDSNVVRGSSADVDIPGWREYDFTSEINQNKFQNIENLVQKLRRLNSSHDEARTDYIASLCENTDPDHRYISEILLASGLLLRDLGSSLMDFQFHASGHPINPELFLVLEQTKASTVLEQECSPEKKTETMMKGKLRRRPIFDTVNEILARKLVSAAGPSTEPWLRPLKLTRKSLNAQKLLRELCSEIEVLQGRNTKCRSDEEGGRWKAVVCKDVMYDQSERWRDYDDEISGAVLDIERSIFKDLVNEIVMGESAGLKSKPASRRTPFAK